MPAKLTSRLTRDAGHRERQTELVIEKTLADMQAEARRRARVDTGTMREGLLWEKTGQFSGVLRGHAQHTIYNELGTRHMSAQPMLVPAAELARPKLIAALQRIWGQQ